MSNYIQKCLNGEVFPDSIDDFIEEWHESNSTLKIFDYLGMTEEEYKYYVADEDVLPFIIKSHRFRKTISETISEYYHGGESFAARASDKDKAKLLIDFLKSEK
ncbi:hypothetical protein [Aliarcobacter butzleri]|uniref:hypothetical protein n=1 Tax=Aliarcobacter butzleri TaxID=28197 RepID=UPI0021B4CC28|nr:hypothetical protein [Aliarcobacter butzleri]MCT7649114.1 hypothetical protein [Aliarcobacter butzleri]MDK2080371.1 hypothetical protein [Aliarcobacter butzleri]